jgi:hypothetical protein
VRQSVASVHVVLGRWHVRIAGLVEARASLVLEGLALDLGSLGSTRLPGRRRA